MDRTSKKNYKGIPSKFYVGPFDREILFIFFDFEYNFIKFWPRGYFWNFLFRPPTWRKCKTHVNQICAENIYIYLCIYGFSV